MAKELKLPTLLVISDNPSIRFWVKKNLDEQFFIIQAGTRQEALQSLSARLDFIILDDAFEDCDPFDLSKEIRTLTQKNLIPLFLITGRLKKSFRDKAALFGVNDFLNSSLDLEEWQAKFAIGQRALSIREKTEGLSASIPVPQINGSSKSFKNQFVLNSQALHLLTMAKNEKKPVAILYVQVNDWVKITKQEEVKQEFSKFLQTFLQKQDVLLSSQEGNWILLLADKTTDAARKMAEEIRKIIQKKSFQATFLTLSMIISTVEASEKGFNKMIDSVVKSLKTHAQTDRIISIDQEPL
jgi:PleD family two-component response regulator